MSGYNSAAQINRQVFLSKTWLVYVCAYRALMQQLPKCIFCSAVAL
nr:MAG TPA: hypothetical protein [Caudoviricetes sp.]